MPTRKKRTRTLASAAYERVLRMEINASEWNREREALLNHMRAEIIDLIRGRTSDLEQNRLLNIARQLADVLIDLRVDLITSDNAPKEPREKVRDLVAAILIEQGWEPELVKEATDRVYDIVQDSPFGRYVP